MMAMTSAPRLYCESSEASGRFTLMMMSASFSASALTVAPTAVNSESGRPDLIPAPGSTATSAPSALNFFTVSGEAATRGSDGSISLATAIFMTFPKSVTSGFAAANLFAICFDWAVKSRLILPAVDRHRRARDEAGIVGGEKDDRAGDLLGLTEAIDRDQRQNA